jgi:hypothetical protein
MPPRKTKVRSISISSYLKYNSRKRPGNHQHDYLSLLGLHSQYLSFCSMAISQPEAQNCARYALNRIASARLAFLSASTHTRSRNQCARVLILCALVLRTTGAAAALSHEADLTADLQISTVRMVLFYFILL